MLCMLPLIMTKLGGLKFIWSLNCQNCGFTCRVYPSPFYSRSLVNCRIRWLCFPLLWVSIEFGTSSNGLVASSLCWIIKQRPSLGTQMELLSTTTERLMTALEGFFLPLCPVNLSSIGLNCLFKENKLKLRLLKFSWGTIQGARFCSSHKPFLALWIWGRTCVQDQAFWQL